jgi:hypothetical protein
MAAAQLQLHSEDKEEKKRMKKTSGERGAMRGWTHKNTVALYPMSLILFSWRSCVVCSFPHHRSLHPRAVCPLARANAADAATQAKAGRCAPRSSNQPHAVCPPTLFSL